MHAWTACWFCMGWGGGVPPLNRPAKDLRGELPLYTRIFGTLVLLTKRSCHDGSCALVFKLLPLLRISMLGWTPAPRLGIERLNHRARLAPAPRAHLRGTAAFLSYDVVDRPRRVKRLAVGANACPMQIPAVPVSVAPSRPKKRRGNGVVVERKGRSQLRQQHVAYAPLSGRQQW